MKDSYTLDGSWQLLPVEAFRQGFYTSNPSAWLEQELPAHWQQHPLLERYAGNMVYRKQFAADQPAGGQRIWLRLNGLFYWSQAYFNGVDLGRHAGYFVPQEHDVTDWVQADNTLIIEVACPDEQVLDRKKMITGVFSHWDCIDPHSNPGGVWLPIELIRTGPTRISHVQLASGQVGDAVAEMRFEAELDSATTSDVTLRWAVAPRNFAGQVQVVEQRRTLAKGLNAISGVVPVRDPQLWWTYDLGHPSCYTVTLEVVQDNAVSDEYRSLFGFRRFEMRNWIPHLNGVRFFAKGNNYAPNVCIATTTLDQYQEDLGRARDAHMNMLRVHAHIQKPEFYEQADLAGIVLWQDFPLQWMYSQSIRDEAVRQSREMIRLLGNHPSVGVWCMHNEPLHIVDLADETPISMIRTYFSVFVWNWNRSVLDSELKKVAEAADRSRPVVRSSGEYWLPFIRRGTDSHFYYGWFLIYGVLRDWERLIGRFPKLMRFVTEFGAQSFPNLESCARFMPTDIRSIDWDDIEAHHQLLPEVMDHWYDWRNARSLAELIEMSQTYQSELNQFYIDRMRHAKYRPAGGVLPFMFRDTSPAVQSSIIDFWGVPKQSYYAMQTAFSPQYAFSLIDADQHAVGDQVELPIYVVNDEHRPVSVQIRAQICDGNGHEIGAIRRDLTLPADSVAFEAERLRLTPETPGMYRLNITLLSDQGAPVEHGYTVEVVKALAKRKKRRVRS